MIKIKVISENDIVSSISIKGHSNYDEFGKDIVCASVSTISTTTVNGILLIDNDSLKYEVNDGLLIINVLKHNEVIDKLILNMLNLLSELEKQYPKNVKIEK